MIITLSGCSHLRVKTVRKRILFPLAHPSGAIPHEVWWQTAGVAMVLVQDLDIPELFFGGKCHPAYNPVSSLHCKLDRCCRCRRIRPRSSMLSLTLSRELVSLFNAVRLFIRYQPPYLSPQTIGTRTPPLNLDSH
jgi:hypothetical protein